MADITTIQDGDITDPATWGGTLPTSSQAAEICNTCTLGDGESFTALSLAIDAGTLTTSGMCSITAPGGIYLSGGEDNPMTQSDGTLYLVGPLSNGGLWWYGMICNGDALIITGDITWSPCEAALVYGGASAVITVNGNITESQWQNGSALFSGSFGGITVNGNVSLILGTFVSGSVGPVVVNGSFSTAPNWGSGGLGDGAYTSVAINPGGTGLTTTEDNALMTVAAQIPVIAAQIAAAAAAILSSIPTDYQQRGQPVTLPADGVVLAASQPNYAPLLAGAAVTLTADERNATADAILARSVAGVEAAADPHSLCYVILAMSESDATTHPGKLTVFCSDGATEFVQKTISAQAGAASITGVH